MQKSLTKDDVKQNGQKNLDKTIPCLHTNSKAEFTIFSLEETFQKLQFYTPENFLTQFPAVSVKITLI